MKESGYKQSQGDHTLFIKHSVAGGVTALLVYVDDIIVTGNDEREKHEVKQRLAIKFEIKELGKLKYFLGIEVAYSTQGIFILNKNIAYSVSMISQFMHDTREPHLQAAYRVLHYLKGNLRERNFVQEEQYSCSRAYTTLTMQIILDDLRIKWDGPMKLYCDNKSTINIAHNPILHDRTKQNKIDRHFIKEKLEKGVVCMSYVASEHQLVDILTKGLNSSMFHSLVFKLGMETSIPQLEGSVEL
ncbi:Retrovirus-related Pol polyprotein from transposon RE1 [Vitis vinifera]|uniref:Retrovirus-related Pol polyprotein from transposon RE1 n=1 Tax=Vitis vinifera TaxID=29760 RepID=A0A438G4J4_VITVI|nr:Retrovirus-related Pol polyprotein from transposon RE1 [Vitis vinifera]